MKKLKKILQSNYLYYLLIFVTIISTIYNLSITNKSKYNKYIESIEGILAEYHIDGDYLTLEIKGLELINGSYYFKTLKEKNNFITNFNIGDKINLTGELSSPLNNTNFNLFNYKKYLYNNNMFYTMNIKDIKKIKSNNNILYLIKNFCLKRIDKLTKSKYYLKAFILGDNKDISLNTRKIYQKLGISHLFAVSGMHVTLLSMLIIKVLKKFKLKDLSTYILVSIFLCLYMFLTGFSPSVLRAALFFILLSFNKVFKLDLKIINVLILTICLIVLFNPLIIYNIGFLFSSVISIYLVIFSELINNRKNYITKLLMTSFIAIISSIPISLYNFSEINYLSIIYNLIFVPLITFIIFPLSLISFIFPVFDNILYPFINLMKNLSAFLNSFNTSLIFIKPNLIVCFIYYILITLVLVGLRKNKKIFLIIFIFTLIFHYNYNSLIKDSYLIAIDVSQGDSILLYNNNKTVLIDTGGKVSFNKTYDWQKRQNKTNLADSTLIPLFKSLGIKKIDCLILSHGDFDHMGEAINLVNNFKVERVIFNCGPYNNLEKELIKILDEKKIEYSTCISELNIDNNKLYFLQTKEYDNENDNSNVIYTEIDGYKFIFMGDAGVDKEKDILDKYNISNVDVLKVGHHGSKTSSSEVFINEINPKYSVISVGKNNRYGHPNKEVLDNLEASKIYRTDQDGSIMLEIKNNKLNIETCSP